MFQILFVLAIINISFVYAFVYQSSSIRMRGMDITMEKKEKAERKDVKRVLQQVIFPNIYSSYEDTVNAGPKKAVKITTETAKAMRERKSFWEMKGDNSKVKVGQYVAPDIPDEKAFEKAMAGLKKIAKPANFAPNRPGVVKLGLGSGPGAECIPDVNKFPKPKKPLVLYETEGNADCKRVREVLSALDIPVIVRPSPSGRYGWSDDQARITYGERTLPYLIDGAGMYMFNLRGSKEIVPYLFENYGPGKDKIPKNLGPVGKSGGGGKMAANARPDFLKIKPVTLYMFEGCQACTPVRKTLEGLGISYKIVPCAKGSKNRSAIEKKYKTFQVPTLI